MEKYIRSKKINVKGELCFQALEWQEFNEKETSYEDDDMDVDMESYGNFHENKEDEKYLIRIFGVNSLGESVCLNVKNFTPFFFVKVPGTWTVIDIRNCIQILKKSLKNCKKKEDDVWKTMDYSGCVMDELCILQNKYDFYGFTNKKVFKFLRLTFSNSAAMKKCVNIIKYNNSGSKKVQGLIKLPLYEANLDSVIRFAHIKNLKFCGWISVKNPKYIESEDSSTHCQIEASVEWKNVEFKDENNNAPILQASYDIETYSIDGKFPSPNVNGNAITQIATSFKYFGSDDFLMKHIICLKKSSDIVPEDNIPVFLECYETEEEVLVAWTRLIIRTDPDILYQYNGDQFDGNYLYKRAVDICRCDEDFLYLGKVKHVKSVLSENKFSSSAYGSSNFKRLTMPGRINFDILIYIKREYKENSYKLDYISEKYIGQNKNPITAQMMFKIFEEGNPDKIREVCRYCLQDTLLPQKLVDKLHILQNQISMSNVSCVPMRYLIERGQQIKVFSQILKETRKQNFLVPTIENAYDETPKSGDESDDESFTGATVLPPLKGAYFEPVTVCDFASLYPSIIRAHNLCFSTIVLDEKYNNIQDVKYKTVEWTDKVGDKEISHKYTYTQSKEGILPKLLAELSLARKEYKKLMGSTDDPFLSEVYNKCQLAVKVSMNSIYGFLAAPMLCCKPIAATVTAVGREMIDNTKKFMEDNYDASVAVYGDSVTGQTPLLLRDPRTNKIHIETIESIFNKEQLIKYPGFKMFDNSNRKEKTYSKTHYESWTDKGWTPIKKVIRHKTNKQIYKISTLSGTVEVTEDHSLLDENCKIIKPTKCNLNTKLLHSYPDIFESKDCGISKDKAVLYGAFYTCGVSDKNSWYFLNENKATLMYVKDILEKVYPEHFFTIEPTTNNNYKLTSKTPDYFIKEYSFGKNVPNDILNSDEEIIKSFVKGFDTCINKTVEYVEQIGSAGMYYLMKKIGLNVYLSVVEDMIVSYVAEDKNYENTNQIIQIEKQDLGELYVYDLETELGRFNAGVGDIQVKNTDSVFIKFKTETSEKYKQAFNIYQNNRENKVIEKEYLKLKRDCIQESINLGKIASKNATKNLFINPISLEYEKVYCPLLLLSKKRYIGVLYSENPEKPDKTDNKGVVLKRRDNFELLKTIYTKLIEILMDKGSYGIDESKEYLESVLYKIINNEYKNLDDFIISKLLKDTYKSKNIPHLVLSRKMKIRDAGSAPKSNDRVPYVFTYPDSKTEEGKKLIEFIKNEREREFIEKVSERHGSKISSLEDALKINKTLVKKVLLKKGNKYSQYEKVEDPAFMLKHNLPLDAEYYITFMKTSICEILTLFMDNPEKIFDDVISEFKNSMW